MPSRLIGWRKTHLAYDWLPRNLALARLGCTLRYWWRALLQATVLANQTADLGGVLGLHPDDLCLLGRSDLDVDEEVAGVRSNPASREHLVERVSDPRLLGTDERVSVLRHRAGSNSPIEGKT